MDPQSLAFAPQFEPWRLQNDIIRVQQIQADHADRLSRLERRQGDDARIKSVWGTSSPFPSVLSGTPQQVPLQHPAADSFNSFEDQSINMIGSLHLDADEEPRRVGATSRANSVRFDESANQGHWAHASRSSVEFIPRTGSGLGGQPMTERSGSHRSDGRASSAHSIRSATSGRANSLNLDSSYSLGNSNTSPLDTPGLAPGLFILGSAPSIIRCWMNTNFKHDSLLYAAVCTGSYRSFLDLRLIKNLGFEDQIERDVEGHRKLTAPVYFPEAVPHPASSRSNSPAPQLPSLTIEFIVIERGEEQAESKAIQIFVGSDVLRAHNADILFSLNSLTLFGDDRCKLSIPLVRPENEATFKDLYITSGTPRSAAPSKQHEQSLGTSALLNGATRNEQSSAASVSSAAVSLSEQPSPSGRYKPMGASSTANGNRVDTPSVAGSTMVHSVHPKLSLGALSTKIENREAAEPSPSQTTPSPAIWGSWRREGSQSSNPDWANANKRKESGMKVLKPKPASRILSGYTTTPGSPSTAQSRFFPEGRRTSAADNEPSLKSPEFGDVSNTANARESQPPSTTATKPRSANPVGSASAFAWLNSGASNFFRAATPVGSSFPSTTASTKKRKLAPLAHSDDNTQGHTYLPPLVSYESSGSASPQSSPQPLPPTLASSHAPTPSPPPPRYIPQHLHDEVFEAASWAASRRQGGSSSSRASSPSEAYAGLTLDSQSDTNMSKSDCNGVKGLENEGGESRSGEDIELASPMRTRTVPIPTERTLAPRSASPAKRSAAHMDHDDNAASKFTLGVGVISGTGAEGGSDNEPSLDGLKCQPCSSNRQEDVPSLQDARDHAWENGRSSNLKTADSVFGSRDTSTSNTDPVAESTSITIVTSSLSTPPPAYNGLERYHFEDRKHQMPTLDEQVNRVKELMHQAFQSRAKEGSRGYVVSMKWLNRVIARTSDAQQEGGHDKAALEGDIGPVDNSTIVPQGWKLDPLGTKDELGLPFIPLRQGLQMGLDLEVVPEDAWQLIMEWYGLSQGSHPIIRYMHDTTPEGSLQHNMQFDLFPPILTIRKLAKNGDTGDLAPLVVAPQHELFQAFLRRAKEAAGANMGNKVKLWRVLEPVESESVEPGNDTAGILTPATSRSGSPSSQSYAAQCPVKLVVGVHSFKSMIEGTHREMIDMKDETMNEKYNGHLRTGTLGLLHDQILVIEPQFKVPGGGEYISDDARKYSKKSAAKSQYPQAQRSGNVSAAPSGPITRGRARNDGRPRGMVGLTNLGNTCYMNSALQCVRSIEELTCYFLGQKYKEELNVDNPLGHHGKMAKVYADLLANIYSERASSSFSPGDFKRTLGSCQPLFSGYGQQDSQEFLSFLVDALHEDLNRIHKKPYIENPESEDKTVNDSEAICALGEKFRENHRARNDSVAMDLFSGFYKNTMVCPQCNKVSITFDPFSLLTLQLPMEVTWTHTVTFAPLHKAPVQIAVDMDKNGTIRNLKEYVAKRITPSPKWNQLMAAEIYSHKFYKLLEDNKTIAETSISDTDEIVLYELDDIPTNFPGPSPKHNKVRSMVTYGNTSSDEEKPDPDSPRGDRMVVPVFHRVLRNHSKGLKLWPSFVLLTRDEAKSYDEVLRKVLAKVTTMTSRDVLSEGSPFTQSRNDSDPVLTTEEDASSTEGPKVTTTSIESEDGIVDVSMSDGPDPVAARELDDVEGTLTHKPALGTSSLPSVLQPGSFIPPSLQGLFEMKYFKEKNAVPTGWSSFSDTRDYPTLQSRMRQPSARRNSTQSVQSRGSQDSGFAQQSGNSSDADDVPELANNQPNALQADADSDDSMPSMEGLLAHRSPQGRQRALNGKSNKFKTYSNKGRRNSRQSIRSARSARSTASKSSNEESVEVVSPSLIRLGEGIILDWSADSFDALFEGSPNSEDEWRGHDTWNDMHVMPDPELDAQKAKRAARKKNGITLDDCFAETAKSEILSEENAWYCNRCKELRRASKTLEIWTVPDILVVHLKRFSANRGFRDKIDVLVDFPIKGLDLSDRVGLQEGKGMLYDLFAVDNHYGGLGGGHYTACAQNIFDKMWYDYNDSHVSQITPERAVASSAYLLFYRRRASYPLGPPYLQKIVAEVHGPLQDSDSQALPTDTSTGNGQRLGSSSPSGSSNVLTTEAAAEGETEEQRLRGGAGTGTTETRLSNDEIGIEEWADPDEVLPHVPPAAPTYHSGATDWNFDGIALGARTDSDDELGGLGGGSVFDDAASNGVNMGQDLNERLLEDFGDDMDFQDMGIGSSRAGTGTPVNRDTTPELMADEPRYATATVHLSPPVEDMDDDSPVAEVLVDDMEYTKHED